MIKIMGDFLNMKMSIIHSLSSRNMRNNTFSVQYSDEFITKSISRVHEEKFACELELLVHFQLD